MTEDAVTRAIRQELAKLLPDIAALIKAEVAKATAEKTAPAEAPAPKTRSRKASAEKAAPAPAPADAEAEVECPSPFCENGRYWRPGMWSKSGIPCKVCKGTGKVTVSRKTRWKPSSVELEMFALWPERKREGWGKK